MIASVALIAVLGLNFVDVDATGEIVCGFTNWAAYRKGEGKFTTEDVDPNLCTTIYYR